MCKIGDILLIYNARSNKRPIGMHPFVVLDDARGLVKGVYAYDFIGLLMTSANTEERKRKLKAIEGNFPIAKDDKIIDDKTKLDSRYAFVEANNFFYFNKQKIKYIRIGRIDSDIYNMVIEFIEEISRDGIQFNQILDKATRIDIEEGDRNNNTTEN